MRSRPLMMASRMAKEYITVLLLACVAAAQQNGNIPHLVQSTGDLGAFGNSVQNGDWVIGNWCSEAPSSVSACSSCSDANGVIPSFTMGSVTTNTSCTANLSDPACGNQQFWGQATSTGLVSLSCTCSFPRQNIFSAIEIGGNLAADNSSTSQTAGANTSINVTSSQQNDIVVDSACRTPGFQNAPATSQNFGGDTNTSDLNAMTNWFNGGASGTLTASWLNIATGTSLSAVAFKPTALTIGTTKMPDGGNGTAYSATLKAYGGSGAYTWSCPAVCNLQSGLSISSAGVVSGTPTATGTNAIGFRVTDGTTTTNLTLSIKTASTLQSIGTPVCSGFSTVPGSASVNAKLNDAALLVYRGEDRHGTTGYLMVTSNTSDNFGDSYFRSTPIAGGQAGAIQVLSTSTLASGTLTPSQTSLGGSPVAGFICDIPGAQQVVDDPVINQSLPGAVASPVSLGATSITTVVPNEVILGIQTMDCLQTGGGSCVMTATCRAPFVQVATVTGFAGIPFTICQLAAPTAGTYSLTSDFSDTTSANMANDTVLQTLIAFRPAVPSAGVTLGEKQRRRMY